MLKLRVTGILVGSCRHLGIGSSSDILLKLFSVGTSGIQRFYIVKEKSHGTMEKGITLLYRVTGWSP